MTKLEKIEQDVEKLSPEELAAFRKWFQAYDAASWDRQLEQDSRAGKLEPFVQEAKAEHQAQSTREL
jgi:predicted esterase